MSCKCKFPSAASKGAPCGKMSQDLGCLKPSGIRQSLFLSFCGQRLLCPLLVPLKQHSLWLLTCGERGSWLLGQHVTIKKMPLHLWKEQPAGEPVFAELSGDSWGVASTGTTSICSGLPPAGATRILLGLSFGENSCLIQHQGPTQLKLRQI